MIHPGRASALAFILAATLCATRAAATDYTFSWSNPKPQGNGLRGVAFENASVGYAVGRLGAVLRSTDGGATWLDRTSVAQFSVDLNDVAILSPGVLLAAGGSSGLFRSNDAGDHWIPVSHPPSFILHNIHRLDATTLTVVGELGAVLRSTDNGVTWSALPSAGSFELRDQFWVSATDGYVCGLGAVRHTTNGGLNWTTLPGVSEAGVPEFHDVFFTDASNGWVLEHFATYRTSNGGVSWSPQNAIFPRPFYQHEGLWIDASTRYVITNLEGADVWKTVNDGQSWTLLYEHSNTEGNTDIDRLPDGTLVTVSSDGDLLRSTNAGASWQNFTLNPGLGERQTLNRMAFTPGGRGFAGGYGALWLRSDDAGASWTFGTPVPPGLGTAYEIEFLNDALGFAGGVMSPSSNPSRICRTTDGGATWTAHMLAPEFGWVHGISIVDAQTQFAVTYGGDGINKVFRSTDGGATWAQRGAGLPLERVECVQFIDASVGYAGGRASTFAARVIKTIDGGATWTPLPGAGLIGGRLVEMRWFNATSGVAAGDGGVFRTVDGGASWTRTLTVHMDDLDFRDALTGFACNYSAAVWQTSDGGQTWNAIALPWTGGSTSVEARPDGFAVCGLASVILAAHEAGVTGVPVPEAVGSEPAGIAFAPNPTTGSIQMRFVSGTAGVCDVTVHDAAGRRVASFRRAVGRGPVALDWQARGVGIHFVSVRDPAGVLHNGRFLLLR